MPKGIANADVSGIEITPEMIEAGVEAYCYEWRGQREAPDEEDVAIAVYRAMVGVLAMVHQSASQ